MRRALLLIGIAVTFILTRTEFLAAEDRLNLVLIAVDGLRADRLPIYGYKRDTAPFLTEKSSSALVFERAISQASWTLPSFASIFTSRYPTQHHANSQYATLDLSERLLTQVLHDHGWQTAGFIGGLMIDPIHGFQRGFDHFRACGAANWRFFPETSAQAIEWIRNHGNRPFFVFLHGNDMHPPFDLTHQGDKFVHIFDGDYSGPVDTFLIDYTFVGMFNRMGKQTIRKKTGLIQAQPDYLDMVRKIRNSPRDIAHIGAHYDGQIFRVDGYIRKVFETLKETGHDKDTIVVLLSDHGLELGEKGVIGTGWHLTQYDTIVHVPLLIWDPKLEGRRVAEPVELIDVAPTLLEMLGLPAEKTFEGHSLVSLASGNAAPDEAHYAFSTSSIIDAKNNRCRMFSIEDRRWKLIYAAQEDSYTLFDLLEDPNEKKDVSKDHPDVVNRLQSVLKQRLSLQ